MSYLVLARKWRPRTFEEVIGQKHVTRVLQNAIRLNRVAHAYLFSGPRGVGKTSVARILAKALNCEKGPTPTPCCECSLCREIAAGKSADVLEIDGASHRGIDSIRSLQESIGYKPIRGRFKIYIIDEVHMLTVEAFNALLKTLEEPPPHVRFIFATTEAHRVPSTVLSRCQRFDFRRISTGEISSHLERIIEAEQVRVDPSVLDAIAVEADGSLRDAQTLLEQVIAFHGEDISDDELLKLLGMVDRTSLLNVLTAIASGNRKTCIKLAQEIYESGCDEVKFLNRLLDLVHRLLIIKMMDFAPGNTSGDRLMMSDHEMAVLSDLAQKLPVETIEIYYQILLRGVELAKRSSQPHFVLEMILLRMANAPYALQMPDLIKTVKKIAERKIPDFPGKQFLSKEHVNLRVIEPEPEIAPELDRGKSAITLDSIPANWEQFLSWLSSHDPVLHVQVSKSAVRPGDKANELILSVMPIYGESLRKGPSHDRLIDSLENFFGISNIILTVEEDAQLARNDRETQRQIDPKKIEREVMSHPLVREILELFNGSIVDVRMNAYSESCDVCDTDDSDYED